MAHRTMSKLTKKRDNMFLGLAYDIVFELFVAIVAALPFFFLRKRFPGLAFEVVPPMTVLVFLVIFLSLDYFRRKRRRSH